MQRQVDCDDGGLREACCLCMKKFAEKKRKALYGVAAADAAQQLNVHIPESSDTGRQFLCHVCDRQRLLRVRKRVKGVEQQKKEVDCLLLLLFQRNAHLYSNSYRIYNILGNITIIVSTLSSHFFLFFLVPQCPHLSCISVTDSTGVTHPFICHCMS